MHAKEIKAVLKEAREAINNKELKIAREKCEEVLKEDSKNYLALVLLGATHQEKDKKEAAKYLRKATTCTEDATIALQGLANCAEPEELPEIFRKLLKLVPEKFEEYHNKIVLAASYSKNVGDCVEILKTEFEEQGDEKRKKSAGKNLARILIKQSEIPAKWEQALRPALKAALDDKQLDNHVEYFKRYLKQLFKLQDLPALIDEACVMSEEYPNNSYPLEWICKVYSENYKKDISSIEKYLKKPIEEYFETLLDITPNSSLGLLVKGIKLMETQQYVQARDILRKLKDIQPKLPIALEFLANCYMNLGGFGIAASILKQFDDASVDIAICHSHSKEINNVNRAVEILAGKLPDLLSDQNEKALIALARSQLILEHQDNASELLEKIRSLGNHKAKTIEAEFANSPEETIKILGDIKEDYFEASLLKGKTYFVTGDYNNALMWLLKATKLKPYYSECFLYLGQVYSGLHDSIRARKCLEKCVSLNPENELAVIQLSAIYRSKEEWDLNEVVLKNALQHLHGVESKWALFQLGLHNLETCNYDDAIYHFRTALRYDLKNIRCWEGLADAYQQRGSFNSAIKVYQKIVDIDSDNSYAKLQIAVIETTLGMCKDAIKCFEDLLIVKPDYLPALKGAAEAHFSLANTLLTQRLLGRCKDHLQEAANYLQKAFLVGKKNMVWLWRTIANVFVMVACLPVSKAHLNVSGKLAGQEEDVVVLDRKELFEFAARFYTCAVKLQPENSLLWHELSICYYKFSTVCEGNDMTEQRLKLAMDASKQSIKLEPTRWQNWNLLGVIYTTKEVNDPAIAQHCFIKALLLDRKSATAWANLGVLYLMQDAIKLANQAFQKAQQSNPSFVNAWIGQAIIAEDLGFEHDAMDLFRHCTQLEFHVESALGYVHWVCSVLSNSENLKDPNYKYAIAKMNAISVALDSINWYICAEDVKSSVESLSYFGFLNVKGRLWRTAIKAYQMAVELCESVPEKDKLLCNLGFAYLKSNHNQEAIDAFNSVSEATVKSTTGLALAYFNDKHYSESYEVYNSALEWLASSEEEKAVILAAMCPMLYMANGETETKTLLYQCIVLSNAPIQAFFAACALGILHKDFQLSETVLEELRKYENDPEHCHHVAFLTSQFYLANNQVKAGLIHLLNRVHTFPNNSLLRGILANYVLQNYRKSKRHLVASCQIAQSTMILGLRDIQRKTSLEASKCLVLASKAMRHVDRKKQHKLALRAIHLHPTSQEAWGALSKCKA